MNNTIRLLTITIRLLTITRLKHRALWLITLFTGVIITNNWHTPSICMRFFNTLFAKRASHVPAEYTHFCQAFWHSFRFESSTYGSTDPINKLRIHQFSSLLIRCITRSVGYPSICSWQRHQCLLIIHCYDRYSY